MQHRRSKESLFDELMRNRSRARSTALRVDRIDHHSVIRKRKSTIRPVAFQWPPKLAPLAPFDQARAAKLRQLLPSTVSTYPSFSVIFWPCPSITDPYLMELIRSQSTSQMISSPLLFLLRWCSANPKCVERTVRLISRSSGGQLSIEPQPRSLAGRDSLRLIFNADQSMEVLTPASSLRFSSTKLPRLTSLLNISRWVSASE